VEARDVRFRTVGDITCTCPVESLAATAADIVIETLAADVSERGATRMDDKTSKLRWRSARKTGTFSTPTPRLHAGRHPLAGGDTSGPAKPVPRSLVKQESS
jgi:hypothetical protein